MKNAKEEFLQFIDRFKVKVIAASIYFGPDYVPDYDENRDEFKLKPLYTDEEYSKFLKFLDREYDAGYGTQELYGTVFGEDGVWMERFEYDGSENWGINKYPDLKEYFNEIDVLKYERSTKIKFIENQNSESSS